MKTYCRSGGIAPCILKLSTRWSELYPWGKSPQYPMDRRLDGPQSWSGHSGEKKFPAPARNQTLESQLSSPQPNHYTA